MKNHNRRQCLFLQEIQNTISTKPPDILFKSEELKKDRTNAPDFKRALKQLIRKGIIEIYKPGVYFKPKITDFGKLGPSEEEKMKLLLKENPKSYISGTTIANAWGLTTQISNEVVVVTDKSKKSERLGKVKIRYRKGLTPQQDGDIELLRILDMIKDFKRLPDNDAERFVKVISKKILNLSENERGRLLNCSKKYNSATRALLGAALEKLNYNEQAKLLKNTLNGSTYYTLTIPEEVLPNKLNWRIR